MFQDQELTDGREALGGGENAFAETEARAPRAPGRQLAPRPQPEGPAQLGRKALVRGALIVGLVLALVAGGYYGHSWWPAGRYLVSPDEAYVGAKSATLSPKVSGYISLVAVEDNARVAAGDVIARIEDGDYRLAVQTARDQVAVQQATIERLGRQTAAQ